MEPGGLLLMMLACISAACGLVLTIRKCAPSPKKLPVTAQWIEELSLERYRPMLRLLDPDEFRLLRSQPGYTPEMIARMRRERCRIFRGYLESLREDFGQVCLAVKLLMVHASDDRPDLASVLLRSRLQFALGMAVVQLRVALYWCGVGTVDVGQLLNTFNLLQVELRSLIPSVAASA